MASLEPVGLDALSPQGAHLLGQCYQALLQHERAGAAFEGAHALNPRNIRVVLALTKVYYDIEYLLSAKRVVARALDERPRHPALWRRSGEIALKEEAYRLALTLDARRLEALFHLTSVYDSYYADKQMAIEQYERFPEQVEEGQLPQMQQYAEQRVQEIREKKFFEEGRVPEPSSLDTLVIKPDSSGSQDRR